MKPETRTYYETAVLRAVGRVTESLDEALDLQALARGASLSPFHFHRVFRGLVGETPLELHRRLRLERAAEQLSVTARPVTEIAFDAGYETHEAFTRAFRARYGVPPSAFRERASSAASTCHGGPTVELASRSRLHVRAGRVDLTTLVLVTGEETMDVTLETMPTLRLATVRHVGPYPEIGAAFHRLGSIAAAAGLYEHADPRMIALYHDDPETTPPSELRSDAALILRDDTAIPADLTEATLPAGRYARFTLRGAYSGLPDAWARLMGEWLPHSGHRVGPGTPYEMYVNNPMTTATDQLLTDLYLPIAE